MSFSDLSSEQVRQTVDVEQVFAAYQDASTTFARRFVGSMSWKTVRGRSYLYRKRRDRWESLGPRSPETEAAYANFHEGRADLQDRLSGLTDRLDRMAPVNRALQLGRLPPIAARILRALDKAGLIGHGLTVVGTNALFAYERLGGVQIAGPYLATGDIDLLFDARHSLRLLAPEAAASGVIGILRKVDHSFGRFGRSGIRAVNRDGYLVDLITAASAEPMRTSPPARIGSAADDLEAIEIEGLVWLINGPKVSATVIDARGYPLAMHVPDPRAFALHKIWLSERADRDPAKRLRDRAQAELIGDLVRSRLPHLAFDAPELSALPLALRRQALILGAEARTPDRTGPRLEPNW